MSTKDRLKNLHDNIINGKNRELENKENRKRQENEAADQAASHEISTLATTLMIKHNLSWSDAIKASKLEIEYRERSEVEQEIE